MALDLLDGTYEASTGWPSSGFVRYRSGALIDYVRRRWRTLTANLAAVTVGLTFQP